MRLTPLELLRVLSAELRSLGPSCGRAFDEASFGGATIRYRDSVPVLTLVGEPRDMGRQHGRLLRDPIRALLGVYLDRFLRSWAPAPGGVEEYLAAAHRMAEHIDPAHREELEGLADGAGISREQALLTQTFLDLHKRYFCSTIVGRTASGRLLFGRNLDFPSTGVVHRFGLVVRHRGDGRRPIASVSWPGLLGVLSGMNDAGLALAVMVVYFVEDAMEGMPYSLLFRRILEEEADLDGVERRLTDGLNTNTNNLMAAAGDREASLFAIRPSGVSRARDAGEGLCSTNHVPGGVTNPLHPVVVSSLVRRAALARRLRAGRGAMDLARVRRALRAAAPPLGNLQAMIFAPGTREIWLSMGTVPAARGRFVHLPAAALFG